MIPVDMAWSEDGGWTIYSAKELTPREKWLAAKQTWEYWRKVWETLPTSDWKDRIWQSMRDLESGMHSSRVRFVVCVLGGREIAQRRTGMKYLQARQSDKGGWSMMINDQPHPCCSHKEKHKDRTAAELCFYKYEMEHSQEMEQAPDGIDSACQFPGCNGHPNKPPNRTLYSLVNAIVKHGKHLCDEHRNIFCLMQIAPFAGSYVIELDDDSPLADTTSRGVVGRIKRFMNL